MSEFEGSLIQLRTENLTEFFTAMPFMAGSVFYMSIIAIGFWLRPGGKTFVQLGVLIPFSILLNLILKNSFAVLRPDEELHLIHVNSMLSFPSSTVMLAVIFWGMIALRWQKTYAIALSVSMVTIILISRIYLGVHSLADVMGGLAFGLIILFWWRSDFIQNIYYKWLNNQSSSYWGLLLATLCLYFFTAEDDIYSQDFVVATGALIGFGISLKTISGWHFESGMFSAKHICSVAISYLMLASLSIVIPTIMINETTKIVSGILEYTLLMFMIYCIFPKLQRLIVRIEQNSKNSMN